MQPSSPQPVDPSLRWLMLPAILAVLTVVASLAFMVAGKEPPETAAAAPEPVTPNEAVASSAVDVDEQSQPDDTPSAQAPESAASPPPASQPAFEPSKTDFPLPRSPFPLPGEAIVRPLAATRLAAATVGLATAPSTVISWDQAPRYVGQTVTVEGTIVRAHHTGRVCFLNFVEDYRGRFYIILFQSALGGWPQPPEDYFPGKTIRVTGEVKLHNSAPQIQVRASDQIQIITSE
jgi:hypothetical protein